MRKATLIVVAALSSPLAVTALSCKHKVAGPAAAAPAAPKGGAPTLPPPPPPKPACESLDEKCQALPETQLAIPTTSVWFHPPPSWTYAKESTISLAIAPNSNAVVAFTRAASEEPDALVPVLEQLFGRLSITKVKAESLRSRLKKPDTVLPTEGVPLRLWEIDGSNGSVTPELNGKRGSLLFVLANFDAQVLVGAGFVVKPEAEAEAPAIMSSVQSLRGSK